MVMYLVERELPGATPESLAAMQLKALAISQQYSAQGLAVRYVRSLFLPDEARCLCLFEAVSAKAVQAANEAAGLPFERIVEAVELMGEGARINPPHNWCCKQDSQSYHS